MQYIWELFYREKYPQVRLVQAECYSPYYELNPLVNPDNLRDKVEYNAFYRFDKIFRNMYLEMQDDKELFDILFDVFSRFLIECDLKKGITITDIKRKKIMYGILRGDYGETVSKVYGTLDEDKQYLLAHYVYLAQEAGGTTVYLFAKAIIALLGRGDIYFDKEDLQGIISYIGSKKNMNDEKIIRLVEALLLPMNMKNTVLWEEHFGIIGEDLTMNMDEVLII